MIKKLTLLVSLALLPLATLSAKKAQPDFSEFKGNYTGTTLLNFITGSYIGPASIQVAVPRNGRSAVVTITGSVSASGMTAPIFGTLTLTKSTLTGSDALFNISPTGPFTVPGKLSKKGFSALGASTVSTTTVLIQSTVKVKPQGKKKKKITITYVISAGSVSYSFQFTGIGKARKN